MYLDRQDMAFRKGKEALLLNKDEIIVYRPGNRIYPNFRGYKKGEVVKARVIDELGSDEKKIPPKFSKRVELFKILEINIYPSCKIDPEIIKELRQKYGDKKDLSVISEIKMSKVKLEGKEDSNNLRKLKDLFDKGVLKLATLPEDNVQNLDELFSADKFSITLINHDYAGLTPKMWNFIAREYGLNIKNTMAIADPKDLEIILNVFNNVGKYIGGGFGVGFKDKGWELLKKSKNGFVNPVADMMQSVNFIAHFGNELHGYNSDAVGYCQSLTDKFTEIGESIKDKNILMLGAGGTARGIALELVNRGIKKLIISNRTVSKAQEIADKLNKIKPGVCEVIDENISSDLGKIDAIINVSIKGADGKFVDYTGLTSTSISIEENLKLSKQILEKFKKLNSKLIVSDINLTRTGTTPLLELAKKYGLNTLDGKLMVVYQGVEAIWTVFGDEIIKKGGTKEEVQEKLLEFIINNKK